MKLALFASFCFLVYLAFGNGIARADSTGGGRNSQQQSGQGQNGGQEYQPFWATRGRRSGGALGRGLMASDSDRIEAVKVEPIEVDDFGSREVIHRPKAETAYYQQRPNPPSKHWIQENSIKDQSNDDSLVQRSLSPNDAVYYFWYNLIKRNSLPNPTPEMPFWAARG